MKEITGEPKEQFIKQLQKFLSLTYYFDQQRLDAKRLLEKYRHIGGICHLCVMKIGTYAVLLFLAQSLSAQRKTEPPAPWMAAGNVNAEHCAKRSHLSFASRIKHYPFNISAQIQFISFDGLVKLSDNGEVSFYSADPPLIGDTVQASLVGMKETRILTLAQIDKLTDILYNYGFAGKVWGTKTRECYTPRDAILFRDSNGKVIAFIELCFLCRNTRESSDEISLGEMCAQKMDMLKALFRQVGIKHGIN